MRVVVFDIDETLIDRKEAFLKYCDYMIDKYGKTHPYQGSKEALIQRMIEVDGNGYGGLKNFIPNIKDIWPLPLTVEEFIRERNEVFGDFSVIKADTIMVLEHLKEKYKLGVITNGYGHVQRKKIEKVGITHYFDDIIVSGETTYAKPDKEIFLLSSEHLGVSTEEMVYIGDYYPNDIVGALGANIRPIWITENTEGHDTEGVIVVKELKEILKFL